MVEGSGSGENEDKKRERPFGPSQLDYLVKYSGYLALRSSICLAASSLVI